MFKFFNKKRQDLLNQNQIMKYLKYAFGEIVLLMLGILFALQVNNWNEYRKDRDKEQLILKELHVDFSDNLTRFYRVKEDQVRTLNNGKIVFRNLKRLQDPKSQDSIRQHAMGMFGGYPYRAECCEHGQ